MIPHNSLFLQQIIKKIHTFDLLLQVGAAIDIQGKRHILMTENLRQRFDIKLRNLNGTDSKRVPYLVKFDLLQAVSFEEPGKELPVSSRFCGLGFTRQEIMVRIVGVELLYNVHQKRWYWYRSCRCLCLRRTNVDVCSPFLFIIDSLHRLIDGNGFVDERDILHLDTAQLTDAKPCK